MKTINIPCFYHPTTIIFLDDNKKFLDALELSLIGSDKYIFLTSPDDAIKLIESGEEDVNKETLKIMDASHIDKVGKRIIDFDVDNIHKAIYNRDRFKYAAIAVVDYEMPDMTGIEFCRKLKDKQIFKIMLTAEADKHTAVKAFNEGIINKFILKQCDNFNEDLIKDINELKNRYFIELSKTLVDNLGIELRNLLNNSIFQKIFNEVLSDAKAIEYYLVDGSGSFLFLDKDANPSWLIIRSKKDFENQIKILDGFDAPPSLIKSLKNKQKVLFLLSEVEYKKPIEQWSDHLFEASPLGDDYYYSFIKGKISNSIKWPLIEIGAK